MNKFYRLKKLTACILTTIIISTLILTGCTKDTNNSTDNKGTDTKKENVSEEDIKRTRQEFDNYMNELFVGEMSESSVSTHFSLENPEDYGIVFKEASWGKPITTETVESSYKEMAAIIEKLEDIDSSLLTDEQQITYDTVYEYTKNSYSIKDLYLFDELFSPINGMQAQIPIIFSEYDFFSKNDIEDYIHLMETVDVYLNNLVDYEKYRAEKGYFLTDSGADEVILQCRDFIEPDENCLISIFSDKLDEFGVSAEEKNDYINRFSAAITEKLKPAYENIITTLEALKGTRTTQLGLSEFNKGSEYYTALVRNYTGSDKTMEQLIEAVEQSIADNISLVYTLSNNNPDIFEEYSLFEYPATDPVTTVEMQIHNAKKYFPETDQIPYEVKSVPQSLESTMSPAFYLVPPIDNKDKNMIYINHSPEYEHMNLFSTLAHEGVPGHMYQCYYFASTNPAPIRNTLNFSGYNEGWATYIEYYAYKFAGMSDSLSLFAASNDRYSFALYSRIDLGIHYQGWDIDDVGEFLNIYGISDESLINDIYDTLIDDPAVYLQYFVGYLEIAELRDKAMDELEDFDIVEFHRFILDMGPTFFDIIDEEMDEWIEENNSDSD